MRFLHLVWTNVLRGGWPCVPLPGTANTLFRVVPGANTLEALGALVGLEQLAEHIANRGLLGAHPFRANWRIVATVPAADHHGKGVEGGLARNMWKNE